MLIDFRCRPPFSGFVTSTIFKDADFHAVFSQSFGFVQSPSVKACSLDMLIDELKAAGVDKAVVPARKLYNVTNEDLVDLINKYPDLFYGMAGIDPEDGDQALAEIDQFVVNGPCVGVTLEPGYCANPLKADDERIFPVYEKCQEHNIPVFLSHGGLVGPLMEYNDPEIIDRVAQIFPNLTIILAHGAYPYVAQACYTCFKNPNVYLVPDFYATEVPLGNEYLKATSWIPEKIIFGSAYPVQPVDQMLEYYRTHMSPEAFEMVTYKNAAKILGIESYTSALYRSNDQITGKEEL